MLPSRLAQVNLSRLRFPLDSAPVREFVAALERINRLAERSPGFVWRNRTDDGTSASRTRPETG